METGQLCRRHSGQDSTARGYVSLFNVLASDETAEALLARTVDGGLDALNSIPTVAAALRDLQYEEEVSGPFRCCTACQPAMVFRDVADRSTRCWNGCADTARSAGAGFGNLTGFSEDDSVRHGREARRRRRRLFHLDGGPWELSDLASDNPAEVHELNRQIGVSFCDPEQGQDRAHRFVQRHIDVREAEGGNVP
jgi:hypothetical protein